MSSVSDVKFAALKLKLRELFELDKSDLDFGIYRIMAAKNKEVTEFLDRQLKDVVQGTLAAHGAGAAAGVEAALAKARQAAADAGILPEDSPKVKELQAQMNASGTAGELEADIYNHLLAFFSRYYDEGDFISQRRYKGDTYAIPYAGEEVTLHWANKDQYYIKSGEWHQDYRFKAASKSVRFKLVEATAETNNNKETEKRRYVLDEKSPVEVNGEELTLRFQFRVPTEMEKARAADRAVEIFGGKYVHKESKKDGKTTSGLKGDECEQFCADAEIRALAAMPIAWQKIVSVASPTESKPQWTLLGRKLDHFTAKNSFDYFIHKDLGGFLKRELDFYLKNEVVRLDDLEALPGDHLARVQGKLKAIRAVATRVIEFLASIEEFQKKLWLKKKLVLNTNWLVTVDRLSDALRDVVAKKDEQWKEWETLGFKPAKAVKNLFGTAKWGTREYLDACDKLVVDTRHFDGEFQAEVLSSDKIDNTGSGIAQSTAGILINSDSFHAIHVCKYSHAGACMYVYADPHYNTGDGSFPYKDGYTHSSWMSMAHQAIDNSICLMANVSLMYCSIDRDENRNLLPLMFGIFGEHDFVEEIIWQKSYGGGSKTILFNNLHEYIICFSKNKSALPKLWLPPSKDAAKYYKFTDDKVKKRGKYRLQPLYTNSNDYRENLTYPIPVPKGIKPDSDKWDRECGKIRQLLKEKKLALTVDPAGKWEAILTVGDESRKWDGDIVLPPIQWQWSWDKTSVALIDNEIVFSWDGNVWGVDYKQYELLEDGSPRGTKPGSILIGPYTQSGTADIESLFGRVVFKFTKPTDLIETLFSVNYTYK